MKRYFIKTSKSNLHQLSRLRLRKLKIDTDTISFYTDKKTYEDISRNFEIEATDLKVSQLKRIWKEHIMTVIGLFLITFLLINQSQSIMRVEFTDSDTYDEEVIEYLESYMKHIGPFSYLNTSLTEINFDLRSRFYHYEWIGIHKKGSVLYVDIKRLVNPPKKEETAPGSYYARVSGIVKRYHIEKGAVVVQEEQYVEKGELLISGDIVHYNNKIESIRAKGYVIAEVLRYHDYTISKSESFRIRTGKLEIHKEYYLFQKQIGKTKTNFSEYEVEIGEVMGNNYLMRKTVYYYETKRIVNSYNEDQAIRYAKSLAVKEFRRTKINEFEKIIFNNLVKIEEDEEFFYVRLIVKSYQNIAEFIPKPS